MKSSLQDYYESMVEKQPDSIKNFLVSNHLNVFSIAAKWFTDTEYKFIINGFRKKIILRPDYIFIKLRERYNKSQNSSTANYLDKPSLQDYYESMVEKQPDSIKNFLVSNHLNVFSIAAKWFTDTEYKFIINGFRKKIILRSDYIFIKLRERYNKSQNSSTANYLKNSKTGTINASEKGTTFEKPGDGIPVMKTSNIRLSILHQSLLVEQYISELKKISKEAQEILYEKNKIRGFDQIIPYLEQKKDIHNSLLKYSRQRSAEIEIIELFEYLRDYALSLQSKTEHPQRRNTNNANQTILHIEKEQPVIIQKREQEAAVKKTVQQCIATSSIQSEYLRLWQNLSVRAQNVLTLNNLNSLEDLNPWLSGAKTSFEHLRKCGKKTADELKQMVSALLTERLKDFNNETNAIIINNDELIAKVQSFINGFLTTASIRTVHLMNYYKLCTAERLLPYILDIKLIAPIQKNHSKASKIYKEYTDFINTVRIELSSLKQSSLGKDILVPLSTYVPLEKTDCEYAILFKEKNGYWPLFSLLHKYYQLTENLQERIFSEYAGFYTNVIKYDEIPNKYGITQERVRQIIYRIKNDPNPIIRDFLSHEDWRKYPIYNISYIGHKNFDIVTNIKQMEGESECAFRIEKKISYSSTTCLSNHDICLLLQYFGFDCYWLDRSNCIISPYYTNAISGEEQILISSAFRDFRFKKALREANRLCRLRTEEDVSIPIKSYFVLNEDYWTKSVLLNEEQSNTLVSILEDLFGFMMDINIQKHQIIIKTDFNYSDAIYQILRLSGKRQSIDNIYTQLVSYCDELGIDCKYSNPSKIRNLLSSDNRITSIGRSAIWGLIEWGETVGSIREIAIHKIKKSRHPIKINDLAKLILEERPDSNEGSVETIIRQATIDNELLLFFGDYIGYPNKNYGKEYILMPRTFDDWLQAFSAFVEKNKRLPYSNQDGYEGYLYRWFYRASQLTELTSDEILKIDALGKELSNYPHNATEYNFLQKCDLFKKFVEGNRRMLTKEDDPELSGWFYNASHNYGSFKDNRYKYFGQLLQSISAILY